MEGEGVIRTRTAVPACDQMEFHLARGGPLYRLMIRVRLLDPDLSGIWRAVLFLVLLDWAPLLLLSIAGGTFVGDAVRMPFIYAIATHSKYLFAVPLFIFAEPFLDKRLALSAGHFVNANLLKDEDHPRFQEVLKKVEKVRDASLPELLLLVFALAAILPGIHYELPRSISTWQLIVADGSVELTPAGWWSEFVSWTIFRFLVFRWLWRLLIWTLFLWLVSQLKLRLYPTHPDKAGGLGFLGISQGFISILVFAGSCALSANFAQTILFLSVPPASFISIIILYILIGFLLVFGPLFVFTPLLFAVKFDGMQTYQAMGTEYNRLFYRKWLVEKGYENETILGSADIQSLASLDQVIGMIRNMRPIPFTFRALYVSVLAAVVPMAPLIGFEISLNDIIFRFLNSFF